MTKQMKLPGIKQTEVAKKASAFVEIKREADRFKDTLTAAEEALIVEMHKAKVNRVMVDGTLVSIKFVEAKDKIKIG